MGYKAEFVFAQLPDVDRSDERAVCSTISQVQVSFGPGSFLDFYCMAYCISYSFHCNDLSNIQNYLP